MQCAQNNEKLKKLVAEHKAEYYNIDSETSEFIAAVTNSTKILKVANPIKEGGMDMFKGMEEYFQEAAEQGEDVFAALAQKLIGDSRMDDLQKAVNDKEYRKKLFLEYAIKSS